MTHRPPVEPVTVSGTAAAVLAHLRSHPDSTKCEIAAVVCRAPYTVHEALMTRRDLFEVSGSKPAVSTVGHHVGRGRRRRTYRARTT